MGHGLAARSVPPWKCPRFRLVSLKVHVQHSASSNPTGSRVVAQAIVRDLLLTIRHELQTSVGPQAIHQLWRS